jgi:Uma2 family endonuclease
MMASTALKPRLFTFDDFCRIIKDHQKADLIDGVIHMASPENLAANDLFVWLISVMSAFVHELRLGTVYGSRVAFRLDRLGSPEPDIAFVRTERLHLAQFGYFDGPPDLGVEIVSPDSVERDYEQKRQQFERAGVREYWIIDPLEQKATILRLGRNRKYREIPQKRGRIDSKVLAGFWLKTGWLWELPHPTVREVLARLIDGKE